MPQQKIARTAFNRGKISRLGLGRVDVERAELTAETQTNWMPRVLGSMMLRPGWKYLGSTLSDSQAFLVPFVKSTDDTAFLEFTNESVRIWEDDAPVERVDVDTSIRGCDFSADVTNFNKLSDPGTTPTGNANGIAFSADGQLMAIAHATSPYVSIYSISGTTFTKLSDPSTLPPAEAFGVAFSPDGAFLAVGHNTSPRITIYSITGTGASATFTKLSDPGSLPPAQSLGVTFSADSSMMAVVHATSPYCTVYSISGTTFTKLTGGDTSEFADSADLPTGQGNGVAFNESGRFLAVAHTTSPFVSIYSINGTTFTKLSNPGTLPASTGNGVAFSRDGLHMAVAHETTPFVTIYSISGTTFTKLSNPSTLPDGNGKAVAFSSDNQFLAVAHATTQYLTLYRYVSAVWTKQSDPGTLPDGDSYGIAFSPNNRFLGVAHDTSAYATLYEAYQWLDMDGSGATSSYAANTWETTSNWTLDGNTGGAGFSGATIRQFISGDHLTRSGDSIRITFKGRAADTFTIDKCYIHYRSTTGDIYDFTGAPFQVTFNSGQPGFTISGANTQVSDTLPFTFLHESGGFIISFHIVSTSDGMATMSNGGAASNRCFYRLSIDDAATVNTSGYTEYSATRDILGVSQIEVLSSAGSQHPGLAMVGTQYNDARRTQSVSVSNTDKTAVHGIRVVVYQGEVSFHVGTTFGAEDLITERRLGVGTYSFAFTPNANLFFINVHTNTEYTSVLSSIQIENAGDLTLPTAYTNGDLTLIRHAQSGDVIYLACQEHKQKKVLRFGAASWGIADYLPADGPFRDENTTFTTLTPSALTGDITLTASRDFFDEDHVGALFRVTSVGQTVEDDINGANQFTSYIKVTNTGTSRDITITRAGTWSATATLQRSISEPGTWVDVATFTSNGTATYNDGLDNQTIYYRIGIKTGNYTSGTATLTLSYSSGSIDGIARITAYTNRTLVSAIVLSPMGGTSAFETWAEGIWSDYRGWPSAVAIYEGRLAWAGMDRIILSESDNYENFDNLVEGDAGPIIRTVGEGPVDNIHWLLPLQRLMAGAEGSELSIRSNSFDEPLTPDNFNMKAASTQGSAAIGAVRIDSNGVFVERSGTRVYQMLYNVDTYDYSSADLTRLVPDMCEAGIKKIVLQRHPDTRLHCILNDGTVAVLIFEPDENTVCWIDITTDGTVEDAVVLPQQELEDAVYYVVNRTINSATKRYVEKWALESECIGGTLNKQADSFYEYSGVSTTTITGLDHLEGESVVVWGGGADLGTYTVTSGQITGLSTAVTSAIVGLTYTAQYKSCKLAYAASPGNSALNARKRIAGLGIIAADMHYQGLKYGQDFDNLVSLHKVYRGKTQTADTVYSEFDDDLTALNSTWTTDARLCLQATAPRPCTLLAVTIVVETNG